MPIFFCFSFDASDGHLAFPGSQIMSLALSSLSFGFQAPALRASVAPAAVSMRQSEALPFLEAPPQLDGSMAGDVVSWRPFR